MIESILRMWSVFEELYNEQNKDVGQAIPSQSDFILLEQVLPILTQMKMLSEECSVETKPTSHLAVAHLFSISHFLTSEVQKDTLKEPIKIFVQVLLEQLTARIPMDEKCVDVLRFAHLLHPFFKGALLKLQNCFVSTTNELIESHQTTTSKTSEKKKQIHLSLHSIKHLYLVMKQKG